MNDSGKNLKIESPNELLELAIGYQRSQVLFTFVELEIAKFLEKERSTAEDLARKLKIHPLAMERFLNASVVIGLLEKHEKFYQNTHLTKHFLTKNKKSYLGGQIRNYQNRSYPIWAELTEKLQAWEYGETSEEKPSEDDQGADALAELHNLALLHGYALAKTFDFGKFKNLLDLGGGTGAMSIGLCEIYPHLNATVCDLPENVVKANDLISQSDLSDRIKTIGGDILNDDLPDAFDIALLANLLSVFDEETNKKLLSRLYDKLPENGACLISGWILDEARLSPPVSVLFCLEDICWNAPDVERSFDVYKGWLEGAGFKNVSYETYLEPTRLICAYK